MTFKNDLVKKRENTQTDIITLKRYSGILRIWQSKNRKQK
jgi:hypothetical protein